MLLTALTLAFAVARNDYSHVGPYMLAQMIGAFLGATLVWLQYHPHFAMTTDPADKLAVFATSPAIRQTRSNLFSEITGTLMLIIGLAGILSRTQGKLAVGMGPFLVGVLVWSLVLSLGGAINPARDLAPRLAHALLPIPGKGSSDWSYGWIPVVGPLVGAVIGGLLIRWFSL